MTSTRTPALAVLLAAISTAALAADPPWYVRKATWQETMVASREAALRRDRGATRTVPLPNFGRDDFTVMAWVRTRRGGTILAKAPSKGGWARQGKSLFVARGRLCYDIGWVGCVKSRGGVADGAWHHVAMTKKGHALRMFIDGRPDTAAELAGGPDVRGHVVKIGYTTRNFPEDAPPGFIGKLDDVRVYSRVLSADEVKAHATELQPATARGLVGCWPFDAGPADASGSGNHATPQGKTAAADGKFGKALTLAGAGRLIVPAGGTRTAGDLIWPLLARDFPAAEARRQMAWEREDRLWLRDWKPGDWPALARRYAEAAHRAADLAKEAARLARGVADGAGLAKVRALYYRSRLRGEAIEAVAGLGPDRLRKAIASLAEDHPRMRKYLERLDAIEKQLVAGATPEALDEATRQLASLRREALVAANPLLAVDKLLFVKRYTYGSSHFYTDFIDGCGRPGGNLCTLSLKDGTVTDLAPSLKDGIFGRFDLSFDATRVVFDWKQRIGKGFRIYEMNVDGTGLRQLTFEPPDEAARVAKYDNSKLGGTSRIYQHHTDDMHPCYLPDGGICFSSTRCEYGTLCDMPDKLSTAVLYRMDGDGKNIERLTNSAVSEFSPCVMHDGRILYSRWEYVDKGQLGAKCLWAMRPDGTNTQEIFGNDHAFPPTLIHGRPIPGSDCQFVVLGTPHYPQSGIGTVIRLDITVPIRTRAPMTYITPDVDIRTEGGFHHRIDGRWVRNGNGPLYMDPFPLSGKFFLVAHNPDKRWNDPRAYGLYLLDELGNHVLIHQDREYSCWQPTPLRPRTRPPVVPSLRPAADPEPATVVMLDVYQGLDGVERGTIKYLRVLEQVPRPWACRRFWDPRGRDGHHSLLSRNSVLGLKVLHGVVPVHPDGSAHFTVPADRNIYFEALDADFMEIQRERTYNNFRPGERRSCIGCHTARERAPDQRSVMALRHPPSPILPQPGDTGPRPLHYPTDVQPILDKHCVKCHGGAKPKAGLDLTGALTKHFCRSYESLFRRRLVRTINEGSDFDGTAPIPPRTVGAHASKLIRHLRKGHSKVKLSRAEMVRLITWVDANCQYYGTYYGRLNIRYRDHPDFRPTPTFADAVSTVGLQPRAPR